MKHYRAEEGCGWWLALKRFDVQIILLLVVLAAVLYSCRQSYINEYVDQHLQGRTASDKEVRTLRGEAGREFE